MLVDTACKQHTSRAASWNLASDMDFSACRSGLGPTDHRTASVADPDEIVEDGESVFVRKVRAEKVCAPWIQY